ncbi:interleukin-20 receptor subunit alpha [Arapaima gigas]
MPVLTVLTTLCHLLLTATAATPPQNAQFRSYNLKNLVEWIPGPGTPNGTRYSVEYAIYGDEEEGSPGQLVWRMKKQCRRVAKTFCDLSSETRDLEEKYYARVRVVSGQEPSEWILTERFDPRSDTIFGPPAINITVKHRTMLIWLYGPTRWQTENSRQEQTMSKYYPQMWYNLSMYNNRTKKPMNFIFQNNSKEFDLLDFNTQYCVTASVFFLSGLYKVQHSQPQCVTTPKDPTEGQLALIILGGIMPTVIIIFLLLLLVFLMYHYIFHNNPVAPENLVFHLDSQQKYFPNMTLLMSLITFKTDVVSLLGDFIPKTVEPFSPPVPLKLEPEGVQPKVYAPQCTYRSQEMREQELELQQVPLMEEVEQEPPTHGSDYGFVMKVPAVEVEGKDNSRDNGLQPAQNQGAEAAVDPYKQQWQPTCLSFLENHDEDEGTIVNWDPDTKRLQIPLLSGFEPEPDPVDIGNFECDQVQSFEILSKVYIRQSSMGSNGSEDDLTKMENNWALKVNMEK